MPELGSVFGGRRDRIVLVGPGHHRLVDGGVHRASRDADDRFLSFHADEKDSVGSRDFYTLEVLPYAGGYVGFTSVYHNMFGLAPAAMGAGKARSPWMDRMDVQLLWSRDAEKFQRVGERRVFIPNGAAGSWDEDLVYSVHNGIVREDLGEIWIYYEGFSGHHWFRQDWEPAKLIGAAEFGCLGEQLDPNMADSLGLPGSPTRRPASEILIRRSRSPVITFPLPLSRRQRGRARKTNLLQSAPHIIHRACGNRPAPHPSRT